MATSVALGKISSMLASAIDRPIKPEAMPAWKMVLDSLPDALAIEAACALLKETKECFPVAPGAVYQAAMKILNQRQPSEGEAWRLALERAEGHLDRGDVPFTVAQAAEQIGWRTLQEVTIDDSTTRAHFLNFYREAMARTGEKRLAEFAAIGRGPARESLSEPTEARSLPAPQDEDEGQYVPICNLRELIQEMSKEVQ
jgi:hypothetical protein